MARSYFWGGAFTVLLFSACAEQSDDRDDSIEGIESLIGVIDVEFGNGDSSEPFQFGRVAGLVEDDLGRAFVADQLNHEVAVFDRAGRHILTFGREGEGPGELSSPCCLAYGPDRNIWVRDTGNSRYVRFEVGDTAASAVATLGMAHPDPWLLVPMTFVENGTLVDVGSAFDPAKGPQLTRFYRDTTGTVIREARVVEPTPEELGTVVKGDAMRRLYFPQPFGPTSLVAHGPEGSLAQAVSDRFRVLGHDAAGKEWVIERAPVSGPDLSVAELHWAQERIQAYVERGGGTSSDYPTVPDQKPALEHLAFDSAGRLWVIVSVTEGSPHRALLFRDGDLVAEATWPWRVRLVQPAWIRGAHALGVVSDSLGVQRVVRVSFTPMDR